MFNTQQFQGRCELIDSDYSLNFWNKANFLHSSFKILIINDNNDMCKYLKRLLKKYWQVKTANNQQTALDILHKCDQSQQIDLLITDIRMAKFDDFQLISILKNHPDTNKIPIIMIITHIEEFDLECTKDVDDFIINTFSERELIARVTTQLQLGNYRQRLVKELDTMGRLHIIATRAMQECDISTILLEILDAVINITSANKGMIHFFNEESKTLRLMTSRGFEQPFLNHFGICSVGRDLYGAALLSNERIIINDITHSSILEGTVDLELLLIEDIYGVQLTVLKNRSGKILGILSTYYQLNHVLNVHDLQKIDLVARLLSDILEKVNWLHEHSKWVEISLEREFNKDYFLAMLSHELRNPLTAISNSSFVISQITMQIDSTKQAQLTINRQLKKIIRIVDDLLDLTRITQNKIQIQRQLIDINEIVYNTIEDNQLILDSLGVILKVTLTDFPVMVYADPIRITQVVSNLLQNAAKFSLAGQTVTISVDIDKNEKQAIIQVADKGIGIESEMLEHIFKPFLQTDRSLNHSKCGLGLGLALVKKIIELHNGNIHVFSGGPDQGADFIVRIPLNISNLENIKVQPDSKEIITSINHRILIIDDNISVADSLSKVLEILGHTIYISHTGYDGIQMAKNLKPNCILCDIDLPGMDGYQVAKILKSDETNQSIYLIALSGYTQSEDIKKSLDSGFNIHLAKPPDLELLKQLLLNIQQ